MIVKVQIPDSTYRQLIGSTIRSKGSLQVTNAEEANFRPYNISTPNRKKPVSVCPLRTGKAEIFADKTIKISLEVDCNVVKDASLIVSSDLDDFNEFLKTL